MPSEARSSSVEATFREAIRACRQGNWWQGLAGLERIAKAYEEGTRFPGYYYSYLGQAIARCQGRKREGLELCRAAVREQPLQAENHCNLAAVYLLLRNRRAAYVAAQKGLAVDPENAELLELVELMGRRRRRAIPLLARSNPVNRVIGKLAHTLSARRSQREAAELY